MRYNKMNSISVQEILAYIESKYRPEIILLGGSRAQGSSRPDSDWDIYLIGDFPNNDHVPQIFQGQDLDLTLYTTDLLKIHVLTIYYGPVSELKVLKDNQQGDGTRIVDETQKAYVRGPGELTSEERRLAIHGLSRLLDKTEAHFADRPVAAFQLAEFFREIVPVWFRLRAEWSLPIGKAIEKIREQDPQFALLLGEWASSSTDRRQLEIGRDLVARLSNINSI